MISTDNVRKILFNHNYLCHLRSIVFNDAEQLQIHLLIPANSLLNYHA
jgi:hypothetical protein